MKDINKDKWTKLHQNNRYRPKYPSETVVQFVFRNFERDGKTKVLDLGCGAGRHVFFMAKEGIVPYGLDYSDEGIEYTKEMLTKYGLSKFVKNISSGSATMLPYENDFFDGIICYGVLYYLRLEEIRQAVSEMKRILKSGGKVLVVVRTIEDYRFDRRNLVEGENHTIIVSEENESRCANSENGMHMHFFDEQELRELFSDFKKVDIDYIRETHDNQQFCDCNYILKAEK